MNTISNDTRIALLCELAYNRVKEDEERLYSYGKGTTLIKKDDFGTRYTEEGQDLFNEFYDYYEGVLLNNLTIKTQK